MALTMNGTTKWPSSKELRRFGETRMGGTPATVKHILESIDEAMTKTRKEIRAYIKEHSEFKEVGERMLKEWEAGAVHSLRPVS